MYCMNATIIWRKIEKYTGILSGMDDTLAEIEKKHKRNVIMERNAFINGRNIWSTWGAELMDGALEAILTPLL